MEQRTVRRRGSEQRKKYRRFTVRLSPEERAELEAAAEREGLTLGSYVRARTLAAPLTRSRRRPSIEVQAVTRLQGEMNRVGSNIHQLVRRLNFGETPLGDEVRDAFQGYREVIAEILHVLGRGRR
ncbi:MAG: hypothetical protein ABL996_07795 [Micropepsaceae bacterium]